VERETQTPGRMGREHACGPPWVAWEYVLAGCLRKHWTCGFGQLTQTLGLQAL